MKDLHQHHDQDHPTPANPAPQPKEPPAKGKEQCESLDWPEKPGEPELKTCEPDPCCRCPSSPDTTSNCLEEKIEDQDAQITAAEKAKAFKAELEALLGKAKKAEQEYTRTKYDELVESWTKQDRDIAELLRKLDCAVPCWYCIIECHVCPLLYEIHEAEQRLRGTGTLYTAVDNLYDLQYWHQRDLTAKQRKFDRIKAVLAAWENPAQTIEKALSDNKKLIEEARKALGTAEASKAVYDVFLRLVPLHLAIAPPDSTVKTIIDKKYTDFCDCDERTRDDCCGPDVGTPSLRDRLVGEQPYLIDPNDYFKVICCLVEHRYEPAKSAAAEAAAALQGVTTRIERLEKKITDDLASLEKRAKGDIPSDVNCHEYQKSEDESQSAL